MSSYLCMKITNAKADICFTQKDVNLFFFFSISGKIKAKIKKKNPARAILSSLGKVGQRRHSSSSKKKLYIIYAFEYNLFC